MTELEWSIRGSAAALDPPQGLVERIWTRDPGAWEGGDDDPAERLGWLDLPETMREHIERLEEVSSEVAARADRVVLLGMGGSSLAPEMFSLMLGSGPERPALEVLDSTHPAQIARVTDEIDPGRTVFVVSSKSGGTVETMSLYRHFRASAEASRFIAITDPGTSLASLAGEEGFMETFINPPDIGGRYSALSLFGLVPASLIGADVTGLLDSAGEAAARCRKEGPDNPGLAIGAAMAEWAAQGRDKLTFRSPSVLEPFGAWAEQLIAESTGKRGKGVVPVVGEPSIGPMGPDRSFVYLSRDAEAEPSIEMPVTADASLGGALFVWEFATAVAGSLLGINAFDQPDVESAKQAAKEALGSGEQISWPEDDPSELFAGIAPGELACLLAFAPASGSTREVLDAARTKLVREHGTATSAGFGPRYLHSTGQLHKGGPGPVRALVVLDVPSDDIPIPGSDDGFAALVTAQAEGDAAALERAGRTVARTTWPAFERWARG